MMQRYRCKEIVARVSLQKVVCNFASAVRGRDVSEAVWSARQPSERRIGEAPGAARGEVEVEHRLDELQLEHGEPPVDAHDVEAGVEQVEGQSRQHRLDLRDILRVPASVASTVPP